MWGFILSFLQLNFGQNLILGKKKQQKKPSATVAVAVLFYKWPLKLHFVDTDFILPC